VTAYVTIHLPAEVTIPAATFYGDHDSDGSYSAAGEQGVRDLIRFLYGSESRAALSVPEVHEAIADHAYITYQEG
jgi:hypothetical protein